MAHGLSLVLAVPIVFGVIQSLSGTKEERNEMLWMMVMFLAIPLVPLGLIMFWVKLVKPLLG
jgi:hypothetical protein